MNDTLIHHFNNVRDEKYNELIEEIKTEIGFLSNQKKYKDIREKMTLLDNLLSKTDYLLIYTRNIARMGYGSDLVDSEISYLYKLYACVEDILDNTIKETINNDRDYIKLKDYHYYINKIWKGNNHLKLEMPDSIKLSVENYQKIINEEKFCTSLSREWSVYKANGCFKDNICLTDLKVLIKDKLAKISTLYLNIKKYQIKMIEKSGYKNSLLYIADKYSLDIKSMNVLANNAHVFLKKSNIKDYLGNNLLKNKGQNNSINICINFNMAMDYLINCLGKLDKDFYDMLIQARDDHWVDFTPRKNKMNGSYTNNIIYTRESIISMTYNDTLNDMCKLAHELGHAYHGYCVSEKGYFFSDFSVITAEIFGLFCENYALICFIMENKLFDQKKEFYVDVLKICASNIKAFQFEYQTFEELKSNNNAQPDLLFNKVLNDIGIETNNIIEKNEWIFRIQNFFPDFFYYNFVYVIGEAVSLQLIIQLFREKIEFKDVKILLKNSGNNDVNALFETLGIDLHNPNLYDIKKSLDEVWKYIVK